MNSQVPGRDHSGYYTHPFETPALKVPSVTTVLSILAKPALVASAAKLSAEYAVRFADKWQTLSEAEAIDLIKRAHRRAWDEKMWRGTAVHRAVELTLLSEPLPEVFEVSDRGQVVATFDRSVIDPYLMQFQAFLDTYRPRFTHVEVEVWHKTHAFAGKLDMAAELCGTTGFIDTKSGDSGVWPEHALQLAAYANAETVVDRKTATEHELAPPGFAAVLHLTPRFFSLVRVDISEDTYRRFRHLAEVWWWQRELAKSMLGLPLPQPEAVDA